MEYVNAFSRHSKFPVLAVNTEFGFPALLLRNRFKCIVMHYSLFGDWPYKLSKRFYRYLSSSSQSYKIAIFQDEYRHCQTRFGFINDYKIDCVYTCIDQAFIPEFYGKYTQAACIKTVLTGYVSQEMVEQAERLTKPDQQRSIDIGYRGRPLPFYMGKGAQEKTEIADGFLARSGGLDLNLDIKMGEEDRIYGDAWYEFLANCRGVLGVESGTSFCDVKDEVRPAVDVLVAENPAITFDEVYEKVLKKVEGHIPIRTISPRHFEAAALRVCQILYEGEYAGMMKPMEHYIPLKKDFSNFREVMRLFRDQETRQRITENAYRDMITSGQYSYKAFINNFDEQLLEGGLTTGDLPAIIARLNVWYAVEEKYLRLIKHIEIFIRYSTVVQRIIKPVLRPILIKIKLIDPAAG